MPRVCITIVYFGHWPVWFSAWLRTCRENRGFHWLIFTDNVPPANAPENVRILHLSQQQLESRVSSMLRVPFVLSRGYKLVDLKPAYGELFSPELADYDFWGYTDLDLVYGDLAGLFTAEILNSHDVLSPSDRLLVGHLTLIRNTPRLCRLYRDCPDYLQILLKDSHEGFDEKGFHRHVIQLAQQQQLRLFLKDMKQEDILLRLNGRGRFLIVWHRGHLYDVAVFRQICHFHFMESKWKQSFDVSEILPAISTFCLTPEAIRPVRSTHDFCLLLLSAAICCVAALPWQLTRAVRNFRNLIRSK
ncbi:MAG: DUF6625 family protein [Planctomyces sp.]